MTVVDVNGQVLTRDLQEQDSRSGGQGMLTFQRESRAPTTLAPLGADLFAFGNTEDIRLRFRRAGGHVTGFDLITIDGQTVKVDRSA